MLAQAVKLMEFKQTLHAGNLTIQKLRKKKLFIPWGYLLHIYVNIKAGYHFEAILSLKFLVYMMLAGRASYIT